MTRRNMAAEVSQRAVLESVDDSGPVQVATVTCDDEDDRLEVEMMLPYGFSCVPPAGSDLVMVQPDADAEAAAGVSAQHAEHRPRDLEPGESCLYGLDGLVLLYIDKNGKIHVGARTATERQVLGDALKTWLDAHVHPTPFGPTGAPVTPLPSSALSDVATVA